MDTVEGKYFPRDMGSAIDEETDKSASKYSNRPLAKRNIPSHNPSLFET
jgi:hypothetical protein